LYVHLLLLIVSRQLGEFTDFKRLVYSNNVFMCRFNVKITKCALRTCGVMRNFILHFVQNRSDSCSYALSGILLSEGKGRDRKEKEMWKGREGRE